MNQSESIAKLAAALSKAQGALNGAKKDSDNPFFKSKYADLESVWHACRQPLADNELSVIQTTDFVEGKPLLITTLAHSSGEWIRSITPLFMTKFDSHTMGSALTYARRYALAAMVGVVQTDDDGNEASKPGAAKVSINQNMNFGPGPEDITIENKQHIDVILKDLDHADVEKISGFFGVTNLKNINHKQYKELVKYHKKKKELVNA